jgi:AcrR family transcriptional regulator
MTKGRMQAANGENGDGGAVTEATRAGHGGSDAPERILRAALQAFSERGFEGATTREIAARADVPLGLLQYHFGGKPKLWRAAVDRAFAELRGGLEGILADPGPADDAARLRRLIRAHVAFVARNPEFVRLMHDEGKRRGPRMRWMVDRHVKPLYEALRPLVERCQASGVLPADVAPVHLVYILVGSVDAIFHQAEECKRLCGLDPATPEAAAEHARAVEQIFLGRQGDGRTHE